jgi:ethanolamine ammonia-lyase small subunit
MHPDPWSILRNRTTARIAMGRAGGSIPTANCLAFAADHADARDAVYSELDVPAFEKSLGMPVISLHSAAEDRITYLKRPDLGRRLDDASARLLESRRGVQAEADAVLIVADGLSATAAQRHGATVILHLMELLKSRRISIAPICVVRLARVAIQDEIGGLLQAKLAMILIGERPGLGLSDSLGAYLIHGPAIGKTDADRNCVSNIHPRHLPPAAAAEAIGWLIEQSIVRQLSGVGLKDERVIESTQPKLPT